MNELEERLKKIEDGITPPTFTHDKDLMDALYKKAKELVVKHNKASVIFLQRKLRLIFKEHQGFWMSFKHIE